MANLDALARTLERVERRQIDRAGQCTIAAPGVGEGTIDADGNWTPPVATVRWSGACWVRPSSRASRTVEVAGAQILLHLTEVKVPIEATVVEGDVLTVTESRDALLERRSLVVREVVFREHSVNRLLICEGSQ